MSSKKSSNFFEKLKNFGERTTFHAIPNACTSERLITKLFWVFNFIVFASLAVWFVQKSVLEYLNYDVHTDIDIVQNDQIDFPTITFCNLEICGFLEYDYTTYLKKYKQDEEDRFKENRDKEIEQNLKTFSTKTNFFSAKEVFLRKYEIEDLTQVLNKTESLLKSMLLNCKFNQQNCRSSDFVFYNMGEFQKCFRFNPPQRTQSSRYGKRNGFKLELYLGTEKSCRSPLATSSGLIVYVHDKTYTLTEEDNGILVKPNTETDIAIDLTSITKLPYPYSTCFKDIESLNISDTRLVKETIKLTDIYTQQYCLQLCFQKFLIKNCDCFDHSLPGYRPLNIQACSKFIDSLYNCQYLIKKLFYNGINDVPCLTQCPKECDYVKYDTTVSSTNYTSKVYYGLLDEINKVLQESGPDETIDKGNVVSLNAYFNTGSMTKITEKPSILPQDLLANVGGAMGLFLGISFLSFVEIIEILIEIIYYLRDKFMWSRQDING